MQGLMGWRQLQEDYGWALIHSLILFVCGHAPDDLRVL
jgi:hypothetical protein